jgi:plastocyanin
VRIWIQASGAAVVSLALTGTAASTGERKLKPKSPAHVISMQIVGFDPPELTVKSGERVTWENKDLFPHTATADDKAFDSKSIAPTAKWTWVAGRPGAYTYTCTFHPNMKGTIRVQ